MECPECHGEGRILLFVSSQECGTCKGTGTRPETPEKPQADKTTDPPGRTLQSAYDHGGGAVTLTSGNATSSGGDIVITAGDCTGTGSAANITVSGSGSSWYRDIAPLTVASGGGPECSIFTGNKEPGELDAPLGSMYMCDDGAGSIWVKTAAGPDGWAQLSTAGDGSHTTDNEITDAINSVLHAGMDRDALIEYVVSQLALQQDVHRRARDLHINDDRLQSWLKEKLGDFPQIGESIPAVAPVCTSIIADMMAMIEQEGHEVVAFVSSSRDFADLRKFGGGHGVQWEGKQCSYFGVPFWHSHKIQPGNMVAVADDRRLVMCTITR